MKNNTRIKGDIPVSSFHFKGASYEDGNIRLDAEKQTVSSGITLRQYFAGLAMQGMAANPQDYSSSIKTIANNAVRLADALLEELSKDD